MREDAGELWTGYVHVPEFGKHAEEGSDVHDWGYTDRAHDYRSHAGAQRPENSVYDFPIQVHRGIYEPQSVHSTRFRVVNIGVAVTITAPTIPAKTAHVLLEVGVHPIARINPHQSQRMDVRKQQGLILHDRPRPSPRRWG